MTRGLFHHPTRRQLWCLGARCTTRRAIHRLPKTHRLNSQWIPFEGAVLSGRRKMREPCLIQRCVGVCKVGPGFHLGLGPNGSQRPLGSLMDVSPDRSARNVLSKQHVVHKSGLAPVCEGCHPCHGSLPWVEQSPFLGQTGIVNHHDLDRAAEWAERVRRLSGESLYAAIIACRPARIDVAREQHREVGSRCPSMLSIMLSKRAPRREIQPPTARPPCCTGTTGRRHRPGSAAKRPLR